MSEEIGCFIISRRPQRIPAYVKQTCAPEFLVDSWNALTMEVYTNFLPNLRHKSNFEGTCFQQCPSAYMSMYQPGQSAIKRVWRYRVSAPYHRSRLFSNKSSNFMAHSWYLACCFIYATFASSPYASLRGVAKSVPHSPQCGQWIRLPADYLLQVG